MQINIVLVGIVLAGLGLCGVIFWLGYSAGESDTNRKILAHQQQIEAAKRWREVLEKLNERGAV